MLHKRRSLILWLCTILLLLGCKSTKSSSEKKADLKILETLLNEKDYKIEVTTVYPFVTAATMEALNSISLANTGNTATRIDVNGDGYYIKFKQDSVTANLPYFGQQRLSSGRYNSDMGVEFQAEPQNYTLTKHKRKDAFVAEFDIRDKHDNVESYEISITFYSNNSVDINIMPSHRTGINYRGRLVTSQ